MRISILGRGAKAVKSAVVEGRNEDLSVGVAADWSEQSSPDEQLGESHLDQEAEAYVAIGEGAFLALARTEPETPILPVAVGSGIGGVERGDLDAAIDSICAGTHETTELQTLSVQAEGEEYRAAMDVMAVTAEAAKISEYEVSTPGAGAERILDTVRADGLLAATPAGTPGYGTAAGGPILDPDLRGVSVIPVGPFRVEQHQWVIQPPVTVRVLREEVPVSLLIDDQEAGQIGQGTSVRISWGKPIQLIRTPESRHPFERTDLEPGDQD